MGSKGLGWWQRWRVWYCFESAAFDDLGEGKFSEKGVALGFFEQAESFFDAGEIVADFSGDGFAGVGFGEFGGLEGFEGGGVLGAEFDETRWWAGREIEELIHDAVGHRRFD